MPHKSKFSIAVIWPLNLFKHYTAVCELSAVGYGTTDRLGTVGIPFPFGHLIS